MEVESSPTTAKSVIPKLKFFYDCLDLLEDVDGHVKVVVLHGGG